MVSASYFDGRTTRVHTVELSVVGDELIVTGIDIDRRIPFAEVVIDERLGRAPRRLRLPGGACCEISDLAALDRLLLATSHRDGWVDRTQRQLGWVLLALLAFAGVVTMTYRWGLPWATATVARRFPTAIAATISAQALRTLDGGLLRKSRIPASRQRSLMTQFDALQFPGRGSAHFPLLFRASPQLGANAFTLPDGTILLLDGLTETLGDDPHIVAALAHELGHAHERHGLQLLLRGTAVGAFLTLYLGDISQLLAAAPAAVVQARYSQEFERQADDYAAALLWQHGLSPGLLADDLSRLSRLLPETAAAGYLASHPPTEERIRHMRELAARHAPVRQ
jgi:Zn-dependent protease with chaperone function